MAHRLQHQWAIWILIHEENVSWEDQVHLFQKITTVEEFWKHIKPFKDIEKVSNLYFFRDGIKPVWEDAQNKNGADLEIKITQDTLLNQSYKCGALMRIILGMIGENFSSNDSIQGIESSFKDRREKSLQKITIWLKDKDDNEACEKLKNELKELLGDVPISFVLRKSS